MIFYYLNYKLLKIILELFLQNATDVTTLKICSTCKASMDKNNIPNYAAYNGFKYPEMPLHLPKLDFVTERLLSPRIPFM